MNNLYIEYRDPLFGIIVFLSMIFFISIISYWWGRYKHNSNQSELEDFFKKFHTLPSDNELKNLLEQEEISQKSFSLLANAFFQNAEYEKAIEIYQHLLLQPITLDEKKEVMLQLGKTYYKAGFLERSRVVFLEILKKMPRTTEALRYLLLVYDQLREYKKALKVIEPLVELGCDVGKDLLYLRLMLIISDTKLSKEQREQRVVEFYKDNHALSYSVFDYLFKNNPKLAWENLDQSQCRKIMDVLYKVSDDNLDLDIIASNEFLRELYSAKGVLELSSTSEIFELDVMMKLPKDVAILSFEYMCNECKLSHPFVFHRCSNCQSVDSIIAEPMLTKGFNREEYYAF